MKNNIKLNPLIESAMFAALAVIIIITTIYLPIFYFVGIIVLPLPFAFVYIKHNFKYAVLALVAAILISIPFGELFTVISLGLTYGLVGIVMVYCFKNDESVLNTIVFMAVIVFLSTILVYKISVLITGEDVLQVTAKGIGNILQKYKGVYESHGASSSKINTLLDENNMVYIMKMIMPGTMFVFSIVSTYLSYRFSTLVFKKFNYTLKEVKSMANWYLEPQISVVLLIFVTISFILAAVKGERGDIYIYNSFLIFTFAFSVIGLGVISFLFERTKMKNVYKNILLTIIVLSPLNNMLFFIGMTDYIFDFRKLDPRRKRYK